MHAYTDGTPSLTSLAEDGEIEVKYLSQGYTKWSGLGSNPRPSDDESDALTVRPPWICEGGMGGFMIWIGCR